MTPWPTKYIYIYLLMVSLAERNGSYGVQSWVPKSVGFKADMWRAISSRILFASGRASCNGARMSIISAHAPHEKADDEAKNKFWDALAAVVSECQGKKRTSVYLLIDANARCAATRSLAIGPCDEERCNQNGFRFTEFLESLNLGPGVTSTLSQHGHLRGTPDTDWVML